MVTPRQPFLTLLAVSLLPYSNGMTPSLANVDIQITPLDTSLDTAQILCKICRNMYILLKMICVPLRLASHFSSLLLTLSHPPSELILMPSSKEPSLEWIIYEFVGLSVCRLLLGARNPGFAAYCLKLRKITMAKCCTYLRPPSKHDRELNTCEDF